MTAIYPFALMCGTFLVLAGESDPRPHPPKEPTMFTIATPRRDAAAADYYRAASALLGELEPAAEIDRFEAVAVDAAHAFRSDYTAELAGAAMVIAEYVRSADTPVLLRRWLEARTAEELLHLVGEALRAGSAGYLRTDGWLRRLNLELLPGTGATVIRRAR